MADCAAQPIFPATDSIVAQREPCAAWCSNTIRTARSRISFEYRFAVPINSTLSQLGASGKAGAVHKCLKNKSISDAERFLAAEIRYELDDRGTVVERPAMIPLARNMRFAFALRERAYGMDSQFDPSSKWWADLLATIRVRDRLMHPKMPGDVDVSPDELIAAMDAYNGFYELRGRYRVREKDDPDEGNASQV